MPAAENIQRKITVIPVIAVEKPALLVAVQRRGIAFEIG
jgi:hypothetical protein